MKRYLVLALAALALAITAPSAFAAKIIFDPPQPGPTGVPPPNGTDCTIGLPFNGTFTPCLVSQLNTPYSVNFVACSTLTGLDPRVSGGWCLFMTNVTGATLNTFRFQFDVPTTGGSLDLSNLLECSSQPAGFASDNCQDGATVTPGDLLDLSFFASLENNKNFYLITDFVKSPGYANVTVSVPEPGALGMFGLGLLAIGVGVGWQKRRRTSRNKRAV